MKEWNHFKRETADFNPKALLVILGIALLIIFVLKKWWLIPIILVIAWGVELGSR